DRSQGNREVPRTRSASERRGSAGETWFHPRERAEGERCSCRLGVGGSDHQPPDLFGGARPARDDADELAPRQDGDPVGDLEQLVEVGRDDERRAAAGGEPADEIADGRRLPYCQPLRRIWEGEQPRADTKNPC